jgi:hypothetical protein
VRGSHAPYENFEAGQHIAGSGVIRKEWLAILLAVIVAGLWMHPLRAQQASRYALTAAIVDHGTVVLDDYEHALGVDRAVRDGRIYSDKGPGQPVLATPFYAAYRAAGGEPAEVLRIERNWGVWWLTLWSAAVPLGMLSVLMSRYLDRRGYTSIAWPVSLAITYGTLLFPFGALLFGHVAAALALFTMLYLLDSEKIGRLSLVLAGVVGGLAVTVEYTAALGVACVTTWAAWRYRQRVWPALVAGAMSAASLAAYNMLAFGGPLALSYRFSAFSEVTESARPMMAMFSDPAVENIVALVVDPRGLILSTPIVIVGFAGVFTLWRTDRHRAFLTSAILLAFLAVVISWSNPWGGDSPGARYLVPALPFLALPVAVVWNRWRILGMGATAIGVVTMLSAVVTDPLVSREDLSGLGTWGRMLLGGDVAPTVLGSNPAAAALIVLSASTVAGMILRRPRERRPVDDQRGDRDGVAR